VASLPDGLGHRLQFDQVVGALLRMLTYNGEMARERRAAAVHANQHGHARYCDVKVAGEVALDPDRDQREREEPDEGGQMAAAIAAIKNVRCQCRRTRSGSPVPDRTGLMRRADRNSRQFCRPLPNPTVNWTLFRPTVSSSLY
jgi:hypothetical protein